ncbi:hypothetical protein glysoja_018468 [Glycine soja]|nr:hypothetical protein glysoja_018468 [Glycine soja]
MTLLETLNHTNSCGILHQIFTNPTCKRNKQWKMFIRQQNILETNQIVEASSSENCGPPKKKQYIPWKELVRKPKRES